MADERAERAVIIAGSPYAAVNIIAKRAHQLTAGAPPRVAPATVPAVTALEELAADELAFR